MASKDKPANTAEAKEPLSRLLVHNDAVESASVSKIKSMLEKGSDEDKIFAMKQTIAMLLSGQPAPQLLVPIIRFVMPNKNHTLKKLVLLYLEVLFLLAVASPAASRPLSPSLALLAYSPLPAF